MQCTATSMVTRWLEPHNVFVTVFATEMFPHAQKLSYTLHTVLDLVAVGNSKTCSLNLWSDEGKGIGPDCDGRQS